MKVVNAVRKLVKDESGVSAVEYALLLALIGAGIATAAYLLGGQVTSNITSATTELAGGAAS